MSFPLARALADLKSPLEKSYRNTIYCASELHQEGGKITAAYCGNRWCLVCNRIRTARAIQRYHPIVATWTDPTLVTLTLQNVPAAALVATIAQMIRDFQAIKLAMRRTDGLKLIGLRKLECTYNRRTDEYHPHFHFVIEGRAAARALLERWLERYPDTTDRRGQDLRPCDARGLRELFKYFTKLVTRKRIRAGDFSDLDAPRSTAVPPVALDVIFRAMHGRRVYQPVGFVVAADAPDDEGDISPDTATDALSVAVATWTWSQGAGAWVVANTGECLSGYEPAAPFQAFVETLGRGPPDFPLED